MINEFGSSMYLHAAGWIGGPQRRTLVARSRDFRQLPLPVDFGMDGRLRVPQPMSRESMVAPLDATLLKASKVARARSAAKCTIFAGLLAQELGPLAQSPGLPGAPAPEGSKIGVGVACSSAVIPIFWRFEPVGLTEGWENTDTLLLPASIPSAVSTASSTITGFRATAMTFGDGAIGMVNALEFAFVGMVQGRFERFLLLGSEEACPTMLDAMDALGLDRPLVDGAAGLVLTSRRLDDADVRVVFTSVHPDAGEDDAVPRGWEDAARLRAVVPDGYALYTSNLMPAVLLHALKQGEADVIAEIEFRGRTVCRVGLSRK